MSIPASKAPVSLRREGRWILLAFALIYAITCCGDMVGDSEVRWLIAKQLIDHGTVALPAGTHLTAPGPDGNAYSWYGVGQPILFIPFVLAGRLLASMVPINATADMLGQFLVALTLFPLIGAAGVWVIHRLAWTLSQSAQVARWMALIFGLGTMHWFYSVLAYEQSQVALMLLSGCFLLWLYVQRRQPRYLYGGLAALGLILMFRPATSVTIAAIWFIALVADLKREGDRPNVGPTVRLWVCAGLLSIGPFIAWMFFYNYLRWGSPFDTGNTYGTAVTGFGADPWANPMLHGLGGMLISPGKGLLIYNPVLWLGLGGLALLWRTGWRFVAAAAMGVILVSLLLHAKFPFWSGGAAWGPRYQASMVGFACLGMIPLLARGRAWRSIVIAVFAASFVIQAASTVFNFSLEYFQKPAHGTAPGPYIWHWSESHLTLRFENIADKLAGRTLLPNEATEPGARAMAAVQYFPFKARAALGGGAIFKMMLALWSALIGLLLLALFRWWRHAL